MHVEARAYVRVRRRAWNFKTEVPHLKVTAEMVMELFPLRATEAAAVLGVSKSTFQRTCRRLGIAKWPTPKQYKTEQERQEEVATTCKTQEERYRIETLAAFCTTTYKTQQECQEEAAMAFFV